MAHNAVRFETLFSAPAEKPAQVLKKEIPPAPGKTAPAEVMTFSELERKYRHRTYQAQELMIEKLLRGHMLQSEALERKLNMFDLSFQHPYYMIVLVRPLSNDNSFIDYAQDTKDGGYGLIVSSIFSELLGEHYSCFPANLDTAYAFLLNISEEAVPDASVTVAAICRDAVKFIQDNFNLQLRVCVSGVCDGLYPLHDVFRETDMVSMDPNTAFTENVCVRAEGANTSGPRKPEPSIEKQYLNALVIQDFHTALQLTLERIRGIYDEGNTTDLGRVKMFLNMRLHTTSNVLAIPLNDVAGNGINLWNDTMHLENCVTIEDVEKALTQFFENLDNHFNSVPSDYTGTTGKVINLISKKYMEPDLSVEMICDCLGKSRSYLSRMFKENTGMNLLDYLHTTRLTEAKKLLNETDLGISEIAAKVGYYSGWTLARVFKRYEGITPTAYRKAFCDGAELS